MPRQQWSLAKGRPVIEIVLTLAPSGQMVPRTVLADTGAGASRVGFELILDEQDCVLCGGRPCQGVSLTGAFLGRFPVYLLRVQLQQLGFDHFVRAVGVPRTPAGLDGIACFRFLNRSSQIGGLDPRLQSLGADRPGFVAADDVHGRGRIDPRFQLRAPVAGVD
jgi:hypothetical protein